VRSRIHRGRQALRDYLAAHSEGATHANPPAASAAQELTD
jgi:RNA polymerase sigma-70 factor, ECF subfamily